MCIYELFRFKIILFLYEYYLNFLKIIWSIFKKEEEVFSLQKLNSHHYRVEFILDRRIITIEFKTPRLPAQEKLEILDSSIKEVINELI